MRKKEKTQVVIDETTIYEIDLACLACDATEVCNDSEGNSKKNQTIKEAR